MNARIDRVALILLSVLAASGCSPPLEGTLERSEIHAKSLNTYYQLGTYIHPDAELSPGAPWLLVLDGDVALESVAAHLDREAAEGRAEPVVLVGIGNQDTRELDYTTYPELDPDPSYDWSEQMGGIEPFFAWVIDEIVPSVEADLGIGGSADSRGVTGHSLGGLATLWVLAHQQEHFRRFGAVSPSLWYDDGIPFVWEAEMAAWAEPPSGRLFLSMGGTEIPGMNDLFDEFVQRLGARSYPELAVEHQVYPGHDHLSVVFEAFPDVLRWLFPPEGAP